MLSAWPDLSVRNASKKSCPSSASSTSNCIEKANDKSKEPVVQVVQLESLPERLTDCRTVPYLRFFRVRNEEVVGSNPISSTKIQKTFPFLAFNQRIH